MHSNIILLGETMTDLQYEEMFLFSDGSERNGFTGYAVIGFTDDGVSFKLAEGDKQRSTIEHAEVFSFAVALNYCLKKVQNGCTKPYTIFYDCSEVWRVLDGFGNDREYRFANHDEKLIEALRTILEPYEISYDGHKPAGIKGINICFKQILAHTLDNEIKQIVVKDDYDATIQAQIDYCKDTIKSLAQEGNFEKAAYYGNAAVDLVAKRAMNTVRSKVLANKAFWTGKGKK